MPGLHKKLWLIDYLRLTRSQRRRRGGELTVAVGSGLNDWPPPLNQLPFSGRGGGRTL